MDVQKPGTGGSGLSSGDSPDQAGFRLSISGRIQGVGFRYWVRQQALRLGVNGWIRNEADGGVTCECQGLHDAVTAFIEALREGPPYAQVDKIETVPIPRASARRGFEITY
ncbi:MAG: acylphosphatase [Spirochaetales bacterium]|jgi:acylphosphatase|nr:acylphosphatase [Spirochaetales bacterium]